MSEDEPQIVTSSRPKRPVQARSQARVARILDAAEAEILISGVDGMTMSGVSARSGTGAGSLYQFFPSKSALLMSLAERYDEQITALAHAVVDNLRTHPAPDIAAAALAFLAPFTAFYRANPAYLILVEDLRRLSPPAGTAGIAETQIAAALGDAIRPFARTDAAHRVSLMARLMLDVGHAAISAALAAPETDREALLHESHLLIAAYAKTLI
jgi:AcrR family transcriptional regulator